MAPLPDVHRLAVLRSGGIGDLVVAEPALSALRAAYPAAELTLLGARQHGELVRHRPGPVDRFVAVPSMPGVQSGRDPFAAAAEVEQFCAAQRAAGYDLVVQLHGGGGHSNPLVRRLGARVTAGPAAPGAVRLDRWVPYSPYQHDTLRWLEVVAAVGGATLRLEPVLAVTPADRDEAAAVLPDDGRPLLAVHPGASEGRRRWHPERLAAVAAGVVAGVAGGGVRGRVVLLGGPGERELVAAVAAALPPRVRREAVDLGGRLRLGGLIGVLSLSTLFLGNDSGPRHLAAAVGTPTVSVHTCANLADVAPLLRTWHRVAVSWASACEMCGLRVVDGDCAHGASALADVPVGEVLAAALELWEQAASAGLPPAPRLAEFDGSAA